ncbi:unnamed protein product [Sphagnum balticum]
MRQHYPRGRFFRASDHNPGQHQFSAAFRASKISSAGQNSKLPIADGGVVPFYTQVQYGAMATEYSIIDVNQALFMGQWDPIETKQMARKKEYDLGIQEIAFLGDSDQLTTFPGLLTQPYVNINTTLITTTFVRNDLYAITDLNRRPDRGVLGPIVITLRQGRSYIVGKEDVIKGGKLRSYPAGPSIREEVELSAGNTIYHVTEKCGKLLASCGDVFVIRIDGKEVPVKNIEKVSVEEQVARLTAKIEELQSKPQRVKKVKAKKEVIV